MYEPTCYFMFGLELTSIAFEAVMYLSRTVWDEILQTLLSLRQCIMHGK